MSFDRASHRSRLVAPCGCETAAECKVHRQWKSYLRRACSGPLVCVREELAMGCPRSRGARCVAGSRRAEASSSRDVYVCAHRDVLLSSEEAETPLANQGELADGSRRRTYWPDAVVMDLTSAAKSACWVLLPGRASAVGKARVEPAVRGVPGERHPLPAKVCALRVADGKATRRWRAQLQHLPSSRPNGQRWPTGAFSGVLASAASDHSPVPTLFVTATQLRVGVHRGIPLGSGSAYVDLFRGGAGVNCVGCARPCSTNMAGLVFAAAVTPLGYNKCP